MPYRRHCHKRDLIALVRATLDRMVEFEDVCIRIGAALVTCPVRTENYIFANPASPKTILAI